MEFVVQARLIERRGDVVVRDETRRNTATELSDAVRTARAHAADGLTVWIYEIHRDSGGRPTYVGVETLSPSRPPPPAVTDRRRLRSGRPGGRR